MENYKISVLGLSGCGKTSITQRYVNNTFTNYMASTIGAAFSVKMYKNPDGSFIRLDIWDCCGQTRFDSIAPIYYRSSKACIVVYDITDLKSYEKAKEWVSILLEEKSEIIIALIGNKLDLENSRSISALEAKQYAESKKIIWDEVSAKDNINISNVYAAIVQAIMKKPLDTTLDLVESDKIILHNRVKDRKKYCHLL